jgi:[acyl-carrier-protein] S-malonyltransferase
VSRAAVVFPGRGAFTPSALGSLPAAHGWVRRADELRRRSSLPTLSELDAAERFDPAVHGRPANAWPLIFVSSLLDAERIAEDHDVVVVAASSTGWYTALAAAGVIGFDDAFRLVQEMALTADGPLTDGTQPAELIYPLVDEAWRAEPARRTALDRALGPEDGAASLALDLGTFGVIGGTAAAVDRVAATLPPVTSAGRAFPLRLPAAGDGWHTALRAAEVAAAAERLTSLSWERPNVTLVDGRGVRFTPWSTDPADLAAYTLTELPTSSFAFVSSLRVALREYAPEIVLLPGPGSSLGAACAHVVVAEGYRGLRSRAEFETAQRGTDPLLLSMRR